MNKIFDYLSISILVILALIFLIRLFTKSNKSCGSMCGGCATSCSSKIIKHGKLQR